MSEGPDVADWLDEADRLGVDASDDVDAAEGDSDRDPVDGDVAAGGVVLRCVDVDVLVRDGRVVLGAAWSGAGRGRSLGAAERLEGDVVGVPTARCTVVLGKGAGAAAPPLDVEVDVTGGEVCRPSAVLSDAAGGVEAGGVVVGRGVAAEMRGRRCTAAGSPERYEVDAPDGDAAADAADGEAAEGELVGVADVAGREVPDVGVADGEAGDGELADLADVGGPDVADVEVAEGELADLADVAGPDVADGEAADGELADAADAAGPDVADVDVADGEATDREMTAGEGADGVVPDGVAGDAVGVVGGVVVRREAGVGVVVDPGLGAARPAGEVSGRPGPVDRVSGGAGGASGATASRCTTVSAVPGVGAAGVPAVRGGVAEVSGLRCTAAASPELDVSAAAADGSALPPGAGAGAEDDDGAGAEAGVRDSFAAAVDASWAGCAAGARCTVDEPGAVAGDIRLPPPPDVVRGPRLGCVEAGVGE